MAEALVAQKCLSVGLIPRKKAIKSYFSNKIKFQCNSARQILQARASLHSENGGASASMNEFTRFVTDGASSKLQTSTVSYWRPGPWWDILRSGTQVDLVSVVHIGDREYFDNLQDELESYDRVLFELVANITKQNKPVKKANSNFRPAKLNRTRKSGGGLIGFIQRLMSSVLNLKFQLECLDYSRENWFHADLDYSTFKKLQKEKGETFLSFARDVSSVSSKVMSKMNEIPSNLPPAQKSLLWLTRFIPMPLIGSLLIETFLSSSDSPLFETPEIRAMLDCDWSRALKVILAKQLTSGTMDEASAVLQDSVIVGERNKVAMEALTEALQSGCSRIAIFYGSAHLPDLDKRLRTEFGFAPVSVRWRTAWNITESKKAHGYQRDAVSQVLKTMATVTNWPLDRYQTASLLLFSAVLAVDLWFWEVLLETSRDALVASIQLVVGLLDRGWEL